MVGEVAGKIYRSAGGRGSRRGTLFRICWRGNARREEIRAAERAQVTEGHSAGTAEGTLRDAGSFQPLGHSDLPTAWLNLNPSGTSQL